MISAAIIDWEGLRARAVEVATRAHAPYSHLHVGAAGVTDQGDVVVGCNVENASYGLTLCAECGLVSNLQTSGAGRLLAVAVADGEGHRLMPCGRCRQVLLEVAGPHVLVDAPGGPRPLADLLPDAFTPTSLPAGR